MDNNSSEKKSLRSLLLKKRDNTSFDYLKIASEKIHQKVRRMENFRDAKKIGAYYPIGSEILTQDIIQELLSIGKEVFLPRVTGETMEFRKIEDFSSLEKGNFGIREPKEECPIDNSPDLILVPAVGISPAGVRLGYGHGFYDKFLAENSTTTISLILEKQVIKNIPKSEHDILIDWIVTEDKVIETQR